MRFLAKCLTLLGTCLLATAAYAGDLSHYNMPRGVTSISRDIYDLHMAVFWICVAIGVGVFAVMIYSMIMHRKSRGVTPAQFHEHTIVEITWAIIPLLILVAMAIPATTLLMRMENSKEADITVKITGYQWRWRYEYLDEGISYFSNLKTPLEEIQNQKAKQQWYLLDVDHPLVLPTHKKVRFLITANDVIHSWWVPELGIKKDAIPGFIHESWAVIDKPGTYRGQCAELCGTNHAFMPIVVVAMDDKDYAHWLAEQNGKKEAVAVETEHKWTKDELLAKGETVFKTTCAVCHKADGTGMPPVFPALKGSKVATTGSVKAHIHLVLNGVPGTAMQAFGQQLSDEDLAAAITYVRNAWGNNTGDIIQPADVAKERG
jgi:cytochrome c oxidase subunit 2